MLLWDANWIYISEAQQERVKKDYGVCLPLVKGGQKRASNEGGGGVSFSVSLKREWGKGGSRIMQAREQTVESHTAYSLTHTAYA